MMGIRKSYAAMLNRLQKLEALQAAGDFIPLMVIGVEDSGLICVGTFGNRQLFENMFEAETYIATIRGVTDQTNIMIDDMPLFPFDLYLPGEPVLYYCNALQRREFMYAGSAASWIRLYVAAVERMLSALVESPEDAPPALGDPALQELIRVRNLFPVDQLVQRFSDSKWFRGVTE